MIQDGTMSARWNDRVRVPPVRGTPSPAAHRRPGEVTGHRCERSRRKDVQCKWLEAWTGRERARRTFASRHLSGGRVTSGGETTL